MKGLSHSFWAKAMAFFLAVLIVPVLTLYIFAAGFYFSGEMTDSFFDSSACDSVVYSVLYDVRETYLLYADFGYGEGGQEAALDALAELYPANDQSSNLRFTLSDKASGRVLYDNRRADDPIIEECDIPCGDGLTIQAYFAADFPARDQIYWAQESYTLLQRLSGQALWMIVLLSAAEIFLVVWLARAAGRRADGSVSPGWQEKLPFDLYLAVATTLFLCSMAMVGEVTYVRSAGWIASLLVAAAGIVTGSVLLLACWMTLCTRVKLGKWWRNTLIFKVCRLCWHIVRGTWRVCIGTVQSVPLVWRTAVVCCIGSLLVLALSLARAEGLLLLLLLALSALAVGFSLQLRQLQGGARALAQGDLSHQIETRRLNGDVRRSAEDLNAIGQGMSIAVEQRLESERLKTELITNVSHDIKTPLTSIVNYVDLLQRDPTDEQRAEYLAVLDRQAKKLKKLTVDLVEMSKASTGNLPCRPARRSLSELVEQAVGEYAERLNAAGLEVVVTLPEEELFCLADGALMWRVLDNLLSNACKYAQSGTRLYLDGAAAEGSVRLSFKNISRDRLNVPAEELMERFVRGDSARSSEGSGLGLNIAQSLMQLQNGTFRVDVDGDLFKATLTLPAA